MYKYLFSSYRPYFKCSATGAVIQGIGLGASALGNLYSADKSAQSQRETNKANTQNVNATNEANLALQREVNSSNERNVTATNLANKQMVAAVNKANYDLWKEQNAEQWRMWNAQNQYDSPAAQMERAKQAGLNPILAMYQGANLGKASAMTAPTPSPNVASLAEAHQAHAAQMQAAHVSPVDYSVYGSAISNSISQLSAMEDVKAKKIDNAFRESDWRLKLETQKADIRTKLASSELSKWQRRDLIRQYNYLRSIEDDLRQQNKFSWQESAQRISLMKEQEQDYFAQRQNIYFQQDLQSAHLKLDQQQSYALLKKMAAEIELLSSQKGATDQAIKESLQRTCKIFAETQGQKISNDSAAYLTRKVMQKYDAEIDRLNAETFRLDNTYEDTRNMFGVNIRNSHRYGRSNKPRHSYNW